MLCLATLHSSKITVNHGPIGLPTVKVKKKKKTTALQKPNESLHCVSRVSCCQTLVVSCDERLGQRALAELRRLLQAKGGCDGTLSALLRPALLQLLQRLACHITAGGQGSGPSGQTNTHTHRQTGWLALIQTDRQ